MTKRFDIIHLPDGMLIVDKSSKPIKGQKFIIMYNDESFMDIEENSLEDFSEYADTDFTDYCYPIIAAYPLMEGVPLVTIPTGGDNIDQLAIDFYRTCNKQEIIMDKGWMKVFEAGYKARAAKGSFTLEQMEEAMLFMARAINKNLSREKADPSFTANGTVSKYLQSLANTPKPIAVVLEVEMIGHPHMWVEYPKLDSGCVIVKEWIYE